jgi:hypothetical protein
MLTQVKFVPIQTETLPKNPSTLRGNAAVDEAERPLGMCVPPCRSLRRSRITIELEARPLFGRGVKVRFRRVSPIAVCPGEGPVTEPTADAQPWPRECVLMPHFGHCRSRTHQRFSLSGKPALGRGLASRNYLGGRDVTRSVLPWHATLDSRHATPPRHCQARAVSNPLPRARSDFLRNPLAAGVGKERNHV